MFLVVVILFFLVLYVNYYDVYIEFDIRILRWMMISGRLMMFCLASLNGRYLVIVIVIVKDFWFVIIMIDFKVGFFGLRMRYGGYMTIIKSRCIVKFYLSTVKMFLIEIALMVFCWLVWLIFNYGIIVNSMILIILSVLENFLI